MKDKFFAFYEGDSFGEVAVFDTEEKRNEWIANEINFPRSPLSYNEVIDILACDPKEAQQREDIVNDNVIWLIAPPIEDEDDFL